MEIAIVRNKQEMERLEGVIQKNLQSFYEVGQALMEIRDKEYYRDVLGYETFEAYCKERWDFKRTYAFYLMESAKVIDNVHNCEQIPVTESQARPLSKIKDPDQQREAWRQAVETAPEGKVTAAHVSKVVNQLINTTEEEHKKRILKRPVGEIVDLEFQNAFDQLLNAIKSLNLSHWKTMSKEVAIKKIQNLIDILNP